MKVMTKYFKKREEAINHLLKNSKCEYTPATFHALRVEIKKLDAFLDIVNSTSEDFERAKVFKPFKEIFDQAGKVREIYIEETTLKKYSAMPLVKLYRDKLKKSRLQEQAHYFSIADKKVVSKLKDSYRKIATVLDQVDKEKVKTYMKEKQNEIIKLLNQQSIKVAHAHDLRKKLKKFNYNRKSLKQEKKYKPLPQEEILPDLLGKWHDGQVIVKHLKKSMATDAINPKEMNELKKVTTKISSKTNSLFRKINKAVASS